MCEVYSAEERKGILDLIIDQAKADERIDGCILVGSGSYGFADQYSDIDICMVASNKIDIPGLSSDWKEKVKSLLPVFWYCKSERGPDILLDNFFLNNCLEINMCFLRHEDLEATKPNWKVVFDRTDSMDSKMSATWARNRARNNLRQYYEERIAAIWHYINHAFVASKRKRYWQALSDIEEIRNQTIKLHGLRKRLVTKRNRDVDKMDSDFLKEIEGTLVAEMRKGAINSAIGKVVSCFFAEAHSVEEELNLDNSELLEKKMDFLLSKL